MKLSYLASIPYIPAEAFQRLGGPNEDSIEVSTVTWGGIPCEWHSYPTRHCFRHPVPKTKKRRIINKWKKKWVAVKINPKDTDP